MTEAFDGTVDDEQSPKEGSSLEGYGGILAGVETETYIMIMMTGDAMINPRWKVRILRKTVTMEISLILVLHLDGQHDV